MTTEVRSDVSPLDAEYEVEIAGARGDILRTLEPHPISWRRAAVVYLAAAAIVSRSARPRRIIDVAKDIVPPGRSDARLRCFYVDLVAAVVRCGVHEAVTWPDLSIVNARLIVNASLPDEFKAALLRECADEERAGVLVGRSLLRVRIAGHQADAAVSRTRPMPYDVWPVRSREQDAALDFDATICANVLRRFAPEAENVVCAYGGLTAMTAAAKTICKSSKVHAVNRRGPAAAGFVPKEEWVALGGAGAGDLVLLDMPASVGQRHGDAVSLVGDRSSVSAAAYLAAATDEIALAWKVVAKRGFLVVSVKPQLAAAYAPSIDLSFEVQRRVASLPGAKYCASVVVVNRDAVLDWKHTPAIEPVSARLFVYRKGLI